MPSLLSDWSLGPPRPEEVESLLALNNAALPEVNELDADGLAALIEAAELAVTARRQGAPAGFLLAFGPGRDYASPNYRWFDARYPDFLYVDRIVVDAGCRGLGIGRALYGAVFRRAEEAVPRRPLCCEVNLRPPNDPSLRFHLSLGFSPVGRQETDGGKKEVALLATEAVSR